MTQELQHLCAIVCNVTNSETNFDRNICWLGKQMNKELLGVVDVTSVSYYFKCFITIVYSFEVKYIIIQDKTQFRCVNYLQNM